MLESLKRIDAFPKAFDDFRVKTTTGAIVSVMSIIIMAVLFFSEMSYFLKTETVDHLYVNGTRASKLKVDFDISFHDIPCNLLSIDVMDDAGIPQKDAVYEIFKHRLSTEGIKQGQPEKSELGNTMRSETELEELVKSKGDQQLALMKSQIGACGNCYGAGLPGQCCQTCADVKQAYQRVGWRFKPHGILQCASEAYLSNMKDQFSEDGGCQLYGSLQLSRGAGHFHIAPHKKLHQQPDGAKGPAGQAGLFNLMDLISFTFDQFNVSHTINTLSFGDNFPGMKSPLDGEVRSVQDTHGMYQYYLKVVPTRYKALYATTEIQSNQYAVTEHMSHLAPGSGRGLPGVYFHYEVSPIQAVFEEKRGGLLGFITSCCAIVGGAFSVMGLVDILLGAFLKMCFKGGVLGE